MVLLWFDVDFQYDITYFRRTKKAYGLWFDVDFQYDITIKFMLIHPSCCGLM